MQSLEDRQKYVKDTHLLKTDLFMKLIEQGKLPLRPGVKRIISKCKSSLVNILPYIACKAKARSFWRDLSSWWALPLSSMAAGHQHHVSNAP